MDSSEVGNYTGRNMPERIPGVFWPFQRIYTDQCFFIWFAIESSENNRDEKTE
jgi:hypothetical protein